MRIRKTMPLLGCHCIGDEVFMGLFVLGRNLDHFKVKLAALLTQRRGIK